MRAYAAAVSTVAGAERYSFLPAPSRPSPTSTGAPAAAGPRPTEDEEAWVAGSVSSLTAGYLVRTCQQGHKIDDMSVVVGIVF